MKTKYQIRYRDNDPGCPVFTWATMAHDAEEAELRFWDSCADDDWEILSIKRCKGGSNARA